MSFGKRRFQSLILTDGQMHAYFLPLDDLTKPAEYMTEEALRAEMASRGALQHTHGEEFLALKAFDQFLRGKKGSRATAEAAVARKGQASFVDPLQPHERALVERWRARVVSKVTTLPDEDSVRDLARRVLTEILDVYLPPKGI